MGTVYIDRKGYHIRLDGDALAFYSKEGREGAAPLQPIKRVVIAGKNTIDTSVIHRIVKQGGTILFLSGRRLHFRGILYGRFHNNGLLRVKQYEMSKNYEFVLKYVKELIIKKIDAQKKLIELSLTHKPQLRIHLDLFIDRLKGILNNITSSKCNLDSLRGYEGAASTAYFSAYSRLFPESLGFRGRNKRPPRDPVNAMLSLCYTLLYYEISTEIYIVGLDPTIGFYHQFEYGRDSLACDIEEPFRPLVDAFVWQLFKERIFTDRDFKEHNGGVFLKKKARARFYPLYEQWALDIRRKIEDELKSLARRLMDGEDIIS